MAGQLNHSPSDQRSQRRLNQEIQETLNFDPNANIQLLLKRPVLRLNSSSVHSFHTRLPRDRVVSFVRRAPPLGPDVRLTLPCGWNIITQSPRRRVAAAACIGHEWRPGRHPAANSTKNGRRSVGSFALGQSGGHVRTTPEQHYARPVLAVQPSRIPLCAFISHAQGSSGVVATMPFVWHGRTKSPTTRAGPILDLALRLE